MNIADDGTNLFVGCEYGHLYYNSNPAGGGAWIDDGSPGSPVWGLACDGTILYKGLLAVP